MLKLISINKIFILYFFLTSFILVPPPCYSKLSDRIVKRYIKEVAKPRKLIITSIGGAMMNDVEKVILGFDSFATMTIDQARILYVNMMEEFLFRINNDERIRPYLHNYPFETHNFDLMLGFRDMQKNIIHDGHVALMYIGRNNELLFKGYDPNAELGYRYYDLHREPYEQALRIVQLQRQSASDSSVCNISIGN